MRQPGRHAAREIERAERRIQQLYERAGAAGEIQPDREQEKSRLFALRYSMGRNPFTSKERK